MNKQRAIGTEIRRARLGKGGGERGGIGPRSRHGQGQNTPSQNPFPFTGQKTRSALEPSAHYRSENFLATHEPSLPLIAANACVKVSADVRAVFRAALTSAGVFGNLRRLAEQELLRIVLDRANRLIDLLERLAAVDRQGLVLAQSTATEAVDAGGYFLRPGIEIVSGLLDRFGGGGNVALHQIVGIARQALELCGQGLNGFAEVVDRA